MKKILFLMIMAITLTVFNGCQKDEPVIRPLTDGNANPLLVNPLFAEIKDIGFSIEDNRLVFESEAEFQKGIDFLAKIGDENFSAFEKEIGFNSYRKAFKGTKNWAKNLEDDLFATLLNPDGYIQVANYLFKIDFEQKKTLAFELIGNETEQKSAVITKQKQVRIFGWNDDVFAVLRNEPILKSVTEDFCTVSRNDEATGSWNSGVLYSLTPYHYITVLSRISYQNYGVYRTFIASTEPTFFETNFLTRIILTMNSVDYVTWHLNCQADKRYATVNQSREYGNIGNRLEQRFFSTTCKVKNYYGVINFSCQIVFGALPPFYNGQTFTETLGIQCN